jgi:hypothetical protein
MIKICGLPSGESFSTVVVVAFEPVTGVIRATYAHSYRGEPDEAAIGRVRETLLKDVRMRIGSDTKIELIQVGLDELQGGWIQRVDPATRAVEVKGGQNSAAGVTRP